MEGWISSHSLGDDPFTKGNPKVVCLETHISESDFLCSSSLMDDHFMHGNPKVLYPQNHFSESEILHAGI